MGTKPKQKRTLSNPTSWQFWAGTIVVLAVLVAAALLYAASIATETSSVEVGECLSLEENEDCILFPTFSGESLTDVETTFPDVFSTDYVILLMVFTKEHQDEVEPWLPVLQELVESYDSLSFYDIPLTPDISTVARGMSKLGTKGIVDSAYHANVVMVYIENRDLFLEVMGMPDFGIPQLIITNTAGEVVWRGDAVYSAEQEIVLREQVALLFGD